MKSKFTVLSMLLVLILTAIPAAVAVGDEVPAPSAGVAPAALYTGGQPAAAAPLGNILGSPAFGSETQNLTFYNFDLDAPETLNSVGPESNYFWSGDFYGDDFSMAYAIRADYSLFVKDTSTGAETLVGLMPTPAGGNYDGMAYDPTTGNMYASSTTIANSYLYLLDLSTPTATLIGEITGAPAIIALGVDGAGNLFGHDIVNDALYGIDKNTGAGTLIGSLGYDANFAQGMDFDPATGQMFISAFNNVTFQAELRTVDTTTGATTLVGVLGSTVPGGLTQVTWLGIEGDAGAMTMHVHDIVGFGPVDGRWVMKVQVADQDHNPLIGVMVDAEITTPMFEWARYRYTNLGGYAKFWTPLMDAGNYQICVANLTLDGYTYEPGDNVYTCMDWDYTP